MGQEATQILEEATHFPHFRPASWRSTGRGSYNFFFTGMAWIFYVHPGNLTCRYQKLPLFKGSYLFQTIILGIHVSFQGCKYLEIYILVPWILHGVGSSYRSHDSEDLKKKRFPKRSSWKELLTFFKWSWTIGAHSIKCGGKKRLDNKHVTCCWNILRDLHLNNLHCTWSRLGFIL